MASVVVLFYVKHVDSVSNTGCLIYVFGVVEQIWVLMDQSLVTFEMYIIDLTQQTETRDFCRSEACKCSCNSKFATSVNFSVVD